MNAIKAVWHGTKKEGNELERALAANCECPEDHSATCVAHKMLLDQRVIDGLLCVRKTVNRFRTKEWSAKTDE